MKHNFWEKIREQVRGKIQEQVWQQIKAEIAIWRVWMLPGMVGIGLIIFARLGGAFQTLEWTVLDQSLRLRPAEPIDQRIVIVGINDADIKQVGTYPIPDREIAQLIKTLQTYQPAVIGLDIFRDLPVAPGHAELVQALRGTQNLIGIEKVLPDQSGTINPPPELPPEQVGFADAVLDTDGYLRRSLLGTTGSEGDYKFSLSIRLAERYLATKGIALENGVRDPIAMRFGTTELTRFQPNSGGYVKADAGGNQVLINFRRGRTPFRIISLNQLQTGQVDPSWIRGNIVLVGITALSAKDVVNSAAIAGSTPGLVYGVEVQAHAVSQIISAVLDQRSLLKVWSDEWEYLWILIWGLLGISVGRFIQSPLKIFLSLGSASVGLVGVGYGLILLGWWIPVAPPLLALILNGAGLVAFSRYEQNLRSRLRERQWVIEHTFDTIHNGPLQTLARTLSRLQGEGLPPDQLLLELQQLNQELRAVHESVRRETLTESHNLYLSHDLTLNLQTPIHEILYEVYSTTLERDFPCFKSIKVKVVKFNPMEERHLRLEHKRGLCRFLEEALCNVGKHATGVTRLQVICTQEQDQQIIRVIDNGIGIGSITEPYKLDLVKGRGTQQAQDLARQLCGKFQRSPHSPTGTVCELIWPLRKPWFWQISRL